MSQIEHLSADEIAALISEDGTNLPAGRSEHAQECDVCRRLIAEHEQAALELEALRAGPRESRTAGCPPSEDWAWLAGGLVEPDRGKELLDHAASCDACGVMLRGMMEDLTGEPAAREAGEISRLRTSSADWQRDFAQKQISGRKPATAPWFRWAAAVASVVVVAAGGRVAYVAWFSAQPEQLIAQAYTEKRPFDFRIAGAAHGRKQQEKRGIGSTFDQPQALREAEARIGENLQRNPDDAQWLALRARTEILRRNAEDAIAVLTRALDTRPGDAALLADLGLAYAIRAENAKRDVDYAMAIEYLSQSLKAKPDVPEVVFNRALVYEQMFLYDLAIEEWRHCLRLEPSGPWADEARGRLSELEKKKKARKDALDRITDDPGAFQNASAAADFEPERYLDIALTRWLPNRDSKNEAALRTLASALLERHGDHWLADVLRAPSSKQSVQGFQTLAETVQANLRAPSEKSAASARQAAAAMKSAGNRAAALRAETELVYALHYSFQPKECVEQALAIEKSAKVARYHWILTQVLLELSTCRNVLGDPGGALLDRIRALAAARESRFRTVELRAEGIIGGPQTSPANQLSTWELSRAGLKKFWDGIHPGIRGQQFYDNLRRAAESLDLQNAALVFSSESVQALTETPHRLFEAVNLAIAANLASKAGLIEEADRRYESAGSIFRTIQDSNPARVSMLYAETWRADAQLFRGDVAAARERLRNVLADAQSLDSALARQQYFQVSGNVCWRSGERDQAGESWRKAVDLSEGRLASARSYEERANVLAQASKAYRGITEMYWTGEVDAEKALNFWEWFRSGDQGRTAREQTSARAGLQRETLLSYAELPDGLVAWIADNRRLEGRRLNVRREDLELVARRFVRLCADPASSPAALSRDARQLYDWLVAPVAQKLDPDRTLVIVPDGAISAIPLQALLDGNSRYLGERFSMVVASSAADYLKRSAALPVNRSSNAVLVADPALGEEMTAAFPPLRQADEEAKIVAALFSRPTLLKGREATLSALERYGSRAELLHFAGHGFSNAGNGGLLLAADGGNGALVLDGRRLAGQDWSRCRLVVLSACSAGTGEARGPVNPESLVRRLLWSGAARVVSSRWNVDAETSVQFFREFYAALLTGNDAAAALRLSANRLRHQPVTNHPYFWAGFQVFGAR